MWVPLFLDPFSWQSKRTCMYLLTNPYLCTYPWIFLYVYICMYLKLKTRFTGVLIIINQYYMDYSSFPQSCQQLATLTVKNLAPFIFHILLNYSISMYMYNALRIINLKGNSFIKNRTLRIYFLPLVVTISTHSQSQLNSVPFSPTDFN